MVRRKLNETISKMYNDGLIDETFVMDAVTHTLGGDCEKSSKEETKQQVQKPGSNLYFWLPCPLFLRPLTSFVLPVQSFLHLHLRQTTAD
jgi:hypothetical protein